MYNVMCLEVPVTSHVLGAGARAGVFDRKGVGADGGVPACGLMQKTRHSSQGWPH